MQSAVITSGQAQCPLTINHAIVVDKVEILPDFPSILTLRVGH